MFNGRKALKEVKNGKTLRVNGVSNAYVTAWDESVTRLIKYSVYGISARKDCST